MSFEDDARQAKLAKLLEMATGQSGAGDSVQEAENAALKTAARTATGADEFQAKLTAQENAPHEVAQKAIGANDAAAGNVVSAAQAYGQTGGVGLPSYNFNTGGSSAGSTGGTSAAELALLKAEADRYNTNLGPGGFAQYGNYHTAGEAQMATLGHAEALSAERLAQDRWAQEMQRQQNEAAYHDAMQQHYATLDADPRTFAFQNAMRTSRGEAPNHVTPAIGSSPAGGFDQRLVPGAMSAVPSPGVPEYLARPAAPASHPATGPLGPVLNAADQAAGWVQAPFRWAAGDAANFLSGGSGKEPTAVPVAPPPAPTMQDVALGQMQPRIDMLRAASGVGGVSDSNVRASQFNPSTSEGYDPRTREGHPENMWAYEQAAGRQMGIDPWILAGQYNPTAGTEYAVGQLTDQNAWQRSGLEAAERARNMQDPNIQAPYTDNEIKTEKLRADPGYTAAVEQIVKPAITQNSQAFQNGSQNATDYTTIDKLNMALYDPQLGLTADVIKQILDDYKASMPQSSGDLADWYQQQP